MQYWLGGSDDNIESLVPVPDFAATPHVLNGVGAGCGPVEYPEVGLYHPDLPGHHMPQILRICHRRWTGRTSVGHVAQLYPWRAIPPYDHVIRTFESRGHAGHSRLCGGLDGRPAIDAYSRGIDALVSLTGFSLVGWPRL